MSYKSYSHCLPFSSAMFFLLFFQSAGLVAQINHVDELVDQRKAQYGGHMAVLAWKNDSLYYKKEAGEININTQESIGAASSWFTAALVLNFVDQGKISLDDPVAKYLPVFRKYAKGYLTIRHCLMHTTGLEVEKGGVQKLFQKNKFASLEEEVDAFASKREIVNNPGQEFYYSNIGLNIVGRVLEVVGRKPFDRLMTERIFRPLGMKKSTFSTEAAVNPHAGARSSAADYIRFLSMLRNKGTFNGKQVLTEKSVSELLKLQEADVKVGFVPKVAEGFAHAPGSWVVDLDGSGKGLSYAAPGIFGSWAYLDTCRDYSYVVIVRNQGKEENRTFYMELKEEFDKLMRACN